MKTTLVPLLSTLAGLFQSPARLHLAVLAPRQQLARASTEAGGDFTPARESVSSVCGSPPVVWLCRHIENIQTRYAGALAPSRFPAVLDVAIQIPPRRQTVDPTGCARPYPSHFAGKSFPGRASRARGTPDAGNRGFPSHDGQVHDPPRNSFAGCAALPSKRCLPPCAHPGRIPTSSA